jgi:hypothetical protein
MVSGALLEYLVTSKASMAAQPGTECDNSRHRECTFALAASAGALHVGNLTSAH